LTSSASLAVDEVDHSLGSAGTIIGLSLIRASREELDGRITLDFIAVSEVSPLSSVDLGDQDVAVPEEGLAKTLVLRSQGLAVTTPRSIELNQSSLVTQNKRIEVIVVKSDDGAGEGFHFAGGADFLIHPLHDAVSSTTTSEVLGLSATLREVLDGRESLDTVFSGEILSSGGVESSDLDVTAVVMKGLEDRTTSRMNILTPQVGRFRQQVSTQELSSCSDHTF
jgi:hypothetical protein